MALYKKLLFILASFVMAMVSITPTVSAQSVRDDSLTVACMEASRLSKTSGGRNWCQCQNDYYASLLTESDWRIYTNDYYALIRKQQSNYSTKANSYERHVQIGNNICQTCAQNDYKGCIRDDGVTPTKAAYHRILSDIRDGQFDRVPRNGLYQAFLADFVNGYSAFCGDQLTDYTERTVTVETWKSVNHVWYKDDTTTNVTRIETSLLGPYLDATEIARNLFVFRLADRFAESLRKMELPLSLISETLTTVVEPVLFMRSELQGQCKAPAVITAYENLKRFEFGLPANTPTSILEKRAALDAVKAQRNASTIAKTQVSAERNLEIYKAEQTKKAALPKGEMSCAAERTRGQAAATSLSNFREKGDKDNWSDLSGTWKGNFGTQAVELAIWNTGPRKDHAIGFSYFPEQDCLMYLRLGEASGASVAGPRVAEMSFNAFSPKWRAGNCVGLVIEDIDLEVHFFKATGFMKWNGSNDPITWYPSYSKLGNITPQQCSGQDVTFEPSTISPAFARLLRGHKYPDRYAAPVPATLFK